MFYLFISIYAKIMFLSLKTSSDLSQKNTKKRDLLRKVLKKGDKSEDEFFIVKTFSLLSICIYLKGKLF